MTEQFVRLLADQSGATAIEFGLVASLVGVAIMGALGSVGSELGVTFGAVDAALETANGSDSGDSSDAGSSPTKEESTNPWRLQDATYN